MTPGELLDALWARRIEVRATDGQLSVRAPQGVLTTDDTALLREQKPALLAELARQGRWGTALSAQQERLWYLDQVQPDLTAYVLPGAFRIDGPLDVEALRGALGDFVDRHQLGRVRIVNTADGPVVDLAADAPLAFTLIESRDILDDPADLAALARWVESAGDVAMPLHTAPLIRFTLIRVHAELHVLMLVVHHAVWDGWCFDIFLRDVGECYTARREARPPQLPVLTASYADFVRQQRVRRTGKSAQAGRTYWGSILAGHLPDLELSTDRPRPAEMTYSGRRVPFALDAQRVASVRALAASEHTTVFVCLLSIYFALLHRASGQDDLVVAVPVQGRTQPEFEDLIGFFVNTVVMRVQFTPQLTFRSLVQQVGAQFVSALEHQDTPFEWLAHEFGRRDPSRTPIFQTMFTHQFAASRREGWSDVRVRSFFRGARSVTTDISLWVREYTDRVDGGLDFRDDLFDDASASALVEAYYRIVTAVTADPELPVSDVPLLDATGLARETLERGGVAREITADDALLVRIAAHAAHTPDRVAVRHDALALTYGDLWRRVTDLAAVLRERGVRPGEPVVVLASRDQHLPAVLLAVLRAGAVYVPFDPGYPDDRLRYMAEDSGARVALVSPDTVAAARAIGLAAIPIDATPIGTPDLPPLARTPATPAYRIYTSGSTGQPKGVDVGHGALDNFLRGIGDMLAFSAEDALLAVTTVSFDISLLELLLPLVCGGAISIASSDDALDAGALATIMTRDGITAMQATPATWRTLLDAGWTGHLRLILCGGEAFPVQLVDGLCERAGAVYNLYGPTETTIWSSAHRVLPADTRVPVGRPLCNTRMFVLDDRRRPVPQGVAGEIWIGGSGVALGYWKRDLLTRERFVSDTVTGVDDARMYRTGDLGRWRGDGTLEHLGRIDAQVKLNGYRIELGEIEAALEAMPEVRQAVADVRGTPEDRRLLAWVLYHDEVTTPPTPSELRRALRTTLPAFMVPAMISSVEEIPMTLNGKVDRRRLTDPLQSARPARTAYEAPVGPIESVIAEEWCRLLSIDRVSRHDNFFEIGGHSLLSLQAVAAIERRVARRIDPRRFFFATLAQLAG